MRVSPEVSGREGREEGRQEADAGAQGDEEETCGPREDRDEARKEEDRRKGGASEVRRGDPGPERGREARRERSRERGREGGRGPEEEELRREEIPHADGTPGKEQILHGRRDAGPRAADDEEDRDAEDRGGRPHGAEESKERGRIPPTPKARTREGRGGPAAEAREPGHGRARDGPSEGPKDVLGGQGQQGRERLWRGDRAGTEAGEDEPREPEEPREQGEKHGGLVETRRAQEGRDPEEARERLRAQGRQGAA